jgi:hypothetical protein
VNRSIARSGWGSAAAAAVVSAALLVPPPAADAHRGKPQGAPKAAAKSRGAAASRSSEPHRRVVRARAAGRKNH